MRILELLADIALPPRESASLVRRLDRQSVLERSSPALRDAGGLFAASLFPYADPIVRAYVLEAKFGGSERAADVLGSALAEFLFEFLSESAAFFPMPTLLVPLPLSPARLKERGYNQVERVLRAAVREDRMQTAAVQIVTDLLLRIRETAPQTSLPGALRRGNVEGAFRAARPCDPYRTYIMVDDVITTGSTMRAACAALRAAGAKRLLPLAFAR